MPLELWRSGRFVGANLSALAYFIMLYGILYFYSIDLQQYKHYSTLAAGLAFLPMTILMALLGPVAGRLSARFSTDTGHGGRAVLVAAAGSLSLALLPTDGSVVDAGWRFALIGIGAGLMNSPMSNTAVSSADARHSGAAVRDPQHVPADRRHPRAWPRSEPSSPPGTTRPGATAAFPAGLGHAMTPSPPCSPSARSSSPSSAGAGHDTRAGMKPAEASAAVTFEAELAFQGPDDGLDALSEPVRERARLLLVFAGGADQGQAQAVAGEEFLGFLPGQALVGDGGGAGQRSLPALSQAM